MEVQLENGVQVQLEPLLSEPNVWRVIPVSTFPEVSVEDIMGLLMTYVDDLFLVGMRALIHKVASGIQGIWSTTDPEHVTDKPDRFRGMEICRDENEEKPHWYITQASYARDLLKNEPDLKRRRIPITRDQAMDIEEEVMEADGRAERVRDAQKGVGELLWMVTRSRPDLMFAVSKMGSGILRNPSGSLAIGEAANSEPQHGGSRAARDHWGVDVCSGPARCLEYCGRIPSRR